MNDTTVTGWATVATDRESVVHEWYVWTIERDGDASFHARKGAPIPLVIAALAEFKAALWRIRGWPDE